MNQKHLQVALAAALVGSALAAGTAFAQGTYGAPAGQQPATTATPPATTAAPPATTTAPASTSMDKGATSGTAMTPSKSEMASSAFSKLDASKRGYVTKADVAQLQGFDAAFQQADANNDGKLTKEEFDKAWAIYSGQKQ